MKKYIIDTQALIKFLNGTTVINKKIDSILKAADEGKNIIIIPSVVIFEIGYLYEKHRVPISIPDIKNILDSSFNYIEEPLTINIIQDSFEISDIPELHDRLIAGTSKYLNIPLITNDPIILKSKHLECVK